MVIWIIGLAGAGKTTIGSQVYNLLKSRKPNVVFLDGEDVRTIVGDDLGHTIEDRKTNIWRICRLCHCLDKQGIDVVCSTLSNQHDAQEWNRKNYTQYFEVYLDVPMDVLVARDHLHPTTAQAAHHHQRLPAPRERDDHPALFSLTHFFSPWLYTSSSCRARDKATGLMISRSSGTGPSLYFSMVAR